MSSIFSHRFHFAFIAVLLALTPVASAQSFDIVITNGHIIDGTGSPWYSGDLGIRDGKIAAIGNLSAAPRATHHRRRRKGRCAGVHRHARPIGTDHSRRPAPAIEDLPGHHLRNHRRRELDRSAQRRDHRSPIGSATSITKSRPTGGRSASTSRVSRSRDLASISPAMSARPRYVAWCSAMRTSSQRPSNSTR